MSPLHQQNVTSPISRFLIVSAAFVIVIAGMKASLPLLIPFLLSVFIAVICSPPLVWLKAKGLPSGLAVLVVILVIVILGITVGAIVSSSINSFSRDLPEYQARLKELSTGALGQLGAWGIDVSSSNLKDSFDPGAALGMAGKTLKSLGNLMTNALLILLTVIFILTEEMHFSDKLKLAIKDHTKTTAAIANFTASVNSYIALKTLMSLITGIVIFVWLTVQGVDYPVLWSLLAFLLNFIPTLGSILAAVPAVLLALVQLGPGDAVITALGFLLVNFIVGNVLEPKLMGRGLNLSTLVVFLSLVFWGWVLGPVGMLLSIPLTVTVKIALESFDDTRWLGVMLGGGNGPRSGGGNEEAEAAELPPPVKES